ncbi:MAG: AAA family ATPase [Pseudomonadota bacterium]|nr:AAA family ATPase [Pseudomonadota bacterium]
MKKLPIGIQSFADIRNNNYCYADKTPLIAELVEQGKFYFLSRPRRFGKSLLIDTIAEAFAGSRELFKGLYLEKHWDWETSYPIIRFDFAEGIMESRKRLELRLSRVLQMQADVFDIKLESEFPDDKLEELIQKLHRRTGQPVVVLVDEYDKPILDNITNPEKATELRDGLRNFYSVLKAQSARLRFVMLTGVSKFSKVSLFSGLNNLKDITLDSRFGTICGYTQDELETVFHEYLDNVDLEQVKTWYNGYNFLAEPVYNPFDVLLYLDSREFKPYWFETGTPTFLIDLIHQQKISSTALEQIEITDTFMGNFDVDFIEPAPLLFQTGYLTIDKAEPYPGGRLYTLDYPNHEVRHAFNGALLTRLTQSGINQDKHKIALLRALQTNNIDQLKNIFHAFFASIPNDWYRKNDIADYEGYYCSIVYCYFTALGLNVIPEDTTSNGRIDMTVLFENRVYIIEFKVNELTQPGRALEQIKKKKYAEKYQNKQTWLIGVEFNKTDRNISRFEWEKVK